MRLKRRRGPQRICNDAVLGQLKWHKPAWHGAVSFPPVAGKVDLVITTGGPEPGEEERGAFVELTRRYDAMLPAIGEELFRLYMPDRGGAPDKPPAPSSPADMIPLTRLGGMAIERREGLRLFYGFIEGAGWDEATFTIRLVDWKPTGEDLRD